MNAVTLSTNKQKELEPLIQRLDEMLKIGNVKLAIDGTSASGKSTLAEALEKLYDCSVIHMDDFFLQKEQRTLERLSEPGGNIDRERFLDEILIPLSRGEQVNYRRFNCMTMTLMPPYVFAPKRLTVIEGVYSMHPLFEKYYDLSVFLEIPDEIQKKRIINRDPLKAQTFFEKWIPLEKIYFEKLRVKARCDITLSIK